MSFTGCFSTNQEADISAEMMVMKVYQNENRTKQKWLMWWSLTFTDIFSCFFVPRNPQKVFIWIVNLFFSLSTLLSPSLLPSLPFFLYPSFPLPSHLPVPYRAGSGAD